MSSASETEAGHQHILSALDGKLDGKRGAAVPAAGAPARRRRRPLLWGGLGVAALAIAAAAYSMLEHDGEPAPTALALAEPHPAPRPAAQTPAPAARAPSPAVPETTPAATAPPPEAAGPAQAAPAAAVLREEQDDAAAKPLADLTPSAPAAATPADKRGHADTLKQALERPSAAKAHAREYAEKRAERRSTDKDKDKAKAKAKEKVPAKARREPDNDVTLLAALMAHIQPVNRKATPAEQLKVCKQYNAAGEEQCRARLCQSVAKNEPACKLAPAAPVAKAPEES